jgi:hypothetical protein
VVDADRIHKVKMKSEILTVFFEIDHSYASIKATSKLLQYKRGSAVLVHFPTNSYEGQIIGRSGIVLFTLCASALLAFCAFTLRFPGFLSLTILKKKLFSATCFLIIVVIL